MSAMSRTNSVGAFQGFSVSQASLGAALQFYPALGTQQLDDLINAYLPGPATLGEKRASITLDFFEYSQLTGETFKYYPVFTQSSSAGSSPVQDSGYASNFVSPVISDWSWSQSTPSSASVSTPTSVTQEVKPSKTAKKAAVSAAKTQLNDFSHMPGMKIMTKDGLDVTNSASRGCKTKEQRDHAHLMRIIKACDACKKKKVRCDPSHKKRSAPQTQSAAPARSAKKVRTSVTQDLRPSTERPQNQSAVVSTPTIFTEPSFVGLDVPDMSLELPESWESFVQFDDEVAGVTPCNFDYDFFFDPAGHLSPQSSQSPATPSMVFSGGIEDSVVLQPALPYMDATAPANNYVDFNLYSPEPSFLDDDAALVTDIGSATGNDPNAFSQQHGLVQNRQSQQSWNERSSSPTDALIANHSALSPSQFLDDPQFVDGDLSQGGLSVFGGLQDVASFSTNSSVSRNVRSSSPSHSELATDFSPTQVIQSPLAGDDSQDNILPPHGQPHGQPQSPHATASAGYVAGVSSRARLRQGMNTTPAIVSGVTSVASPALPSPSQVPLPPALVASSSLLSSSLMELPRHAKTSTVLCSDGDSVGMGGSVIGTTTMATMTSTDGYLQVTSDRSSVSRGTTAPLSSESSVADTFGPDGASFTMAAIVSDGVVFSRHSLAGQSSLQLLISMALLAAALGTVAAFLEAQIVVDGVLQIALGLAMYMAYHHSSQNDSRPQQSRLSSTSKPQGFSDGARLLSCVSTRLRYTRLQNQATHCRARPAARSVVLGFAQGLR